MRGSRVAVWYVLTCLAIFVPTRSVLAANSQSERVKCPFEEAARKRQIKELTDAQILVGHNKFEEAVDILAAQRPLPNPGQLWIGLFATYSPNALSSLLATSNMTERDAHTFFQDFRTSLLKEIRSRRGKRAMSVGDVMYQIVRAEVKQVALVSDRVSRLERADPAGELASQRSYLRELLRGHIARLYAVEEQIVLLGSDPGRANQMQGELYKAIKQYLTLSGVAFTEEDVKLTPLHKGGPALFITPGMATELNRLAKNAETRIRDVPFRIGYHSTHPEAGYAPETRQIYIDPVTILTDGKDPIKLAEMRQGMQQVAMRHRRTPGGVAVTFTVGHGKDAVSTANRSNSYIQSDALMKQLAKTVDSVPVKDRDAFVVHTGGAARGMWIDSHDVVERTSVFLQHLENARAYLRGLGRDGSVNITGGEEDNLIVVHFPDFAHSKNMIQLSVYLGAGVPIVALVDPATQEQAIFDPPYPKDLEGALNDLIHVVRHGTPLFEGSDFVDFRGTDRLVLLNLMNKLKRRLELREAVSSGLIGDTLAIQRAALRYLTNPSEDAYQKFATALKNYKGFDAGRVTLRESRAREAATPIDGFEGIVGIPTAPYLVGQLKSAVGTRSTARHERDRAVEEISMETVIAYLDVLGYSWQDRSGDNVGYDIEAVNPRTGEKRFIEVKGLFKPDGRSSVKLSRQEIQFAQHPDHKSDAMVAVVFVGEDGQTKLHFVSEPKLGGELGAETGRDYLVRNLFTESKLVFHNPSIHDFFQSGYLDTRTSSIQTFQDLAQFFKTAKQEEIDTLMRAVRRLPEYPERPALEGPAKPD